MGEYTNLPLGVDLGASRIRMAHLERHRSGAIRLRAVASRNVGDLPSPSDAIELLAAVVDDLLRELGVRERRCVLGLGSPDAVLRVLSMPKMSRIERSRAAAFEAARFLPWNPESEPTVVRVHPVDRKRERYAIGAARKAAIDTLARVARASKLRVVAIDHDACALKRALPDADAVLDIGVARSTLHTYGGETPLSWHAAVGGDDVTQAIARDLAIDAAAAERRKRILGTAGAGAHAVADLVARLASLIESARRRAPLTRIVLTGNGARLPDLASSLERASGATAELSVATVLRGDAYPDDVVRSAAPDWTMAAGLALHGVHA